MKKGMNFFCLCFCVVAFYASCATMSSNVRAKGMDPEMIDHKNKQFGKEIPEWVSMEQYDIENLPRYKDVYVFKFVSERAKDLEGSQIWMKNFTVASEISKLISQRIIDKAASAVGGNSSSIDSYTKELVKLVSEANISGLKKESDYWTLKRFFKADGDVEGDFYSTFMLYSVPKKVLDGIIKEAINKANEADKPKSQEEIDLRNMVNKAMQEEF
ncbi:MAG: hypothetical protein ACTTKH_01285 [Treponema sp.]